MASTHIEIPGTASRYSASLRALIDQLRNVQGQVIKHKDIADTIAAGADWDALATKLGTSAAEAETVYNLLTSLNAAISDAAVVNNFIDRLG